MIVTATISTKAIIIRVTQGKMIVDRTNVGRAAMLKMDIVETTTARKGARMTAAPMTIVKMSLVETARSCMIEAICGVRLA
jgi:hypothetical protein